MRFLIRLAALALIIFGLYTAWNTYQFTQVAQSARGVVTEVYPSEYVVGQAVVIEYRDKKRGRTDGYIPFVVSEEPLVVDQPVEILFNPNDTWEIQLNDPLSIWFIPGAAILLGLFIRIIFRPKRRVRRVENRRIEPAHEIRSSTTYQHLPSNETAENHARETISKPTVRRMH